MSVKEVVSQLNVQILPLNEGDIQQLEPILLQHVKNRLTDEIEYGEIEEIKDCTRGGKDSHGRVRKYLVAKDESGKVWGCMGYAEPDPDMKKHFGVDGSRETELLNTFVASEMFRGGGIGRKLFEAVCETVKKGGKEVLLINSGPRYQKSWGFYDKMGCEPCGFIIGKYGLDGDAKTWRKVLI